MQKVQQKPSWAYLVPLIIAGLIGMIFLIHSWLVINGKVDMSASFNVDKKQQTISGNININAKETSSKVDIDK